MKIYGLLFLFTTSTLALSAQSEPITENMSQGLQPGVIINLNTLGPKACEKYWRAYLGAQGSKAQRDRKTKEWVAPAARVDGTNMTVYSRVDGKGDHSNVVAWFLIDDTFVDDMNLTDHFEATKTFMNDFAHYVRVEEMRLEVEAEEKEMKKLASAMSKLERDRAHYEQEIEKAKSRIKTMENNIVKNKSDQETMQGKMDKQQEVVNEARQSLQELRKRE